MIATARAAGCTLLAGALLTSLVACSGATKPGRVVTVTVPPSGATSSGSASSRSGSGSPTSSAPATVQRALPGGCGDLLGDYAVAQAATGSYTLGATSFVVGVAQKDIGRLANINCRYGVTGTGTAQKRKVEIGVSLYATPAQAAARISATESDYTAHGAQASAVTVAGAQGQYLTGGAGADYADPTLVVAVDQRTIAVTVTSTLAGGAAAQTAATKVATLAAEKTAG